MKPARLVLVLLLGLLGFCIALWINRNATQRDAQLWLENCGPKPSEPALAEAHEQCLAAVRHRAQPGAAKPVR